MSRLVNVWSNQPKLFRDKPNPSSRSLPCFDVVDFSVSSIAVSKISLNLSFSVVCPTLTKFPYKILVTTAKKNHLLCKVVSVSSTVVDSVHASVSELESDGRVVGASEEEKVDLVSSVSSES